MDNKNKYRATILGSDYTIVAPESEEYLENLCNEVNEKINAIAKTQDLKPMKISVLTAINFCDELIKTREELDKLKKQVSAYSEQEQKLKREISALEEEKRYLKDVISGTRR